MMPVPKPAVFAAAWLILCAASAATQQASAYDVTVAGLQRFQNADIARMTPAMVTRHIDDSTDPIDISGLANHGRRWQYTADPIGSGRAAR